MKLKVEVEYRNPDRWLVWTLETDRPARRVLASVTALHPDAHAIEVSVVRAYPAAHIRHPWPGTVLTPYQLPGGEIVKIDEEVARGARRLDFTLKGGEIVDAWRL